MHVPGKLLRTSELTRGRLNRWLRRRILAVDRKQAHEVVRIAYELGITGIGWKQHGASRFVHLDDLHEADGHVPRPTIWSYP